MQTQRVPYGVIPQSRWLKRLFHGTVSVSGGRHSETISKAVSEQVRVSNVINGTTGVDGCLNNVREIYFKMLEYPGTRTYFYDSEPCPDQGGERERILIMAEVLADVLETQSSWTAPFTGRRHAHSASW